ncbi:MAG: HAD family hydrolase [Clostridia bacterium]|nr:HAD family hydrolase [Clostridia bacterium]
MKLDAILFDLDGTLLPMDIDEFTGGYLGFLAKTLAPYGYKKETLLPAMWKGVAAMVKNDGKAYNSELFWRVFAEHLGDGVYEQVSVLDDFYRNEFNEAVAFCAPTPSAAEAVSAAKEKAKYVVLATNPIFPSSAVQSRLNWTNISADSFALITDYDNSRFCKPNPAYYTEITDKLGVDPRNCLMIGNNADEDIAAAQSAGLSTFLLTDCLIAKGDIPETPRGDFGALIKYINSL